MTMMKRFWTYEEFASLSDPIDTSIEPGDPGHVEMHMKLAMRANYTPYIAYISMEKYEGQWYSSQSDEVMPNYEFESLTGNKDFIFVFTDGEGFPENVSFDDIDDGRELAVYSIQTPENFSKTFRDLNSTMTEILSRLNQG